MPKYKEIVVLPKTTINGKEYYRGQQIRVVEITEREAALNNKTPYLTGCKYVPVKAKSSKVNKEEMEMMITEAKKLGIELTKGATVETIQDLINKAKEDEADEKPEDNEAELREKLFAEAKELKLRLPKNTSTAKLKQRIAEAEVEDKPEEEKAEADVETEDE